MADTPSPETPSAGAPEAPPPVLGAPAPAGGDAAPRRDTHFDFEHKVFGLPDAVFSIAPDTKQPVLHIMLGDLRAQLPFNTLMESFGIAEDSPDGRLLGKVQQGLQYVKLIRPGERIPGELLDGSASWSVEDRHRAVARGRVTMQFVSWATGSETLVVDPAQLEQIVEDPQTQERLAAAYAKACQTLALGADGEAQVRGRVEGLIQELSYIEGLRDHYLRVRAIRAGLDAAARLYRSDRNLLGEINRMQGLFRRPIAEFEAVFDQADAQTGEVVGVLRSYDTTVQFIRKIRDDLRSRLMEWEELIQMWGGLAQPLEAAQKTENALKATYRFLARRYMEAKVWQRK